MYSFFFTFYKVSHLHSGSNLKALSRRVWNVFSTQRFYAKQRLNSQKTLIARLIADKSINHSSQETRASSVSMIQKNPSQTRRNLGWDTLRTSVITPSNSFANEGERTWLWQRGEINLARRDLIMFRHHHFFEASRSPFVSPARKICLVRAIEMIAHVAAFSPREDLRKNYNASR